MKATGVVRKIDELGIIVIPIEIREKDPMEIFVEGSNIVLKKFETNCIFCGSSKKLVEYKDKLICSKCAKKLSELSEKE